jgi:hypothetical protein
MLGAIFQTAISPAVDLHQCAALVLLRTAVTVSTAEIRFLVVIQVQRRQEYVSSRGCYHYQQISDYCWPVVQEVDGRLRQLRFLYTSLHIITAYLLHRENSPSEGNLPEVNGSTMGCISGRETWLGCDPLWRRRLRRSQKTKPTNNTAAAILPTAIPDMVPAVKGVLLPTITDTLLAVGVLVPAVINLAEELRVVFVPVPVLLIVVVAVVFVLVLLLIVVFVLVLLLIVVVGAMPAVEVWVAVVMIDVAEVLRGVFVLVLMMIVVELQWVYTLFAFACWFFCIVSRVYMLKIQG